MTLLGCTEPRLFTPPLRELNAQTSLGLECIEFAETVLGETLDPWQRYLLLHALEVHDGRFRFRTCLWLLSRQQGKSYLLRTVILWAMFTGRVRLVLGVAQSIGMARETWQSCIDTINALPHLRSELVKVRNVNGEQEFTLANGARYKIAANNRSSGRGLSVDLLVLDELREHRDWDGWSALSATTAARPFALTLCTSNAGDDQSVVLNQLREGALSGRDPSLGIFEWSAPDGCALDDLDAICLANPALGYGRLTLAAIQSAAATDPPSTFRTERLCQRVDALDNAIDAVAWKDSRDTAEIQQGARLGVCFDISIDSAHASLVVAEATGDGRFRVAVAKSWRDVRDVRSDLQGLLDKLNPARLAWFPSGPAAGYAPIFEARGATSLSGLAATEACMGLADLVSSRLILHNGDPLLDAQISGVSKLRAGDGWRFMRRGVGHADAAYAAAGAVLMAQQLPPERPNWSRLVL